MQGSTLKKLFYKFFGIPPNVFRWHFRWKEHQHTMKIIQQELETKNGKDTKSFYTTLTSSILCAIRAGLKIR